MTGSLQKTNRSKYWYAVISVPDGKGKTKPKWISTRCTKKTEAREILRALINEYEEKQLSRSNQRSTNADTILFTDYMIKWHSTAVDGVMEDTTSDSYLDNIVNHILPYFKDQNLYLSEVKRSHIQSFIRDLHEHGRKDGKGGLKVTSIKKYVANISCAFEMAIGDELLDSNPCTHLKYPVDEAYEANYLKVDHLQELLRLVKGTSIESAIYFAIFYALRRGEILGMKWSAIDFDQNIIRICNNRVRIHREIEKKPKNRSSKADMPLIPIVREYLLELKEQQKKNQKLFGTKYQKNDYVCKHEDGTRFECNYINYKLSKILDENNMPHVTLHGLRHSTATMLASLGYSDIEIQSWLRHNDIKSTMRYTHDSLDLRKNASQAMNNIFTLG